MRTVPLAEAAVTLRKSERTVRRLLVAGELQGEQVLHDGRYRWMVTLPESTPVPAVIDTPDVLATLQRIEAKLDALLEAQSAPAGILPIAADTVAAHSEAPPPVRERRWWHWIVWG